MYESCITWTFLADCLASKVFYDKINLIKHAKSTKEN